jgi:RNA polymerase sigma-70 factor (ECF subfamily)
MQRLEASAGPDAALAARAAAGDHAAFAAIMRANNQALYRVARSMLRDDAEAEDALQSSYLKAYLALNQFAGRAALSSWLTRIVINECLERRRRRAARGEETAPALPGDDNAIAEAADTAANPETHAARVELASVIERAIDALPEGFRVVFTLRAIEGRSVEEIAADLAVAEATVRTRYHRARQTLQERLKDEFRAALDGVFPFAGARCENLVTRVLAKLPALPSDPIH